MDQTINSDLTMLATKAFNNILDCVQNSCLNYQVQLSPFSAVISIKKTLVKNMQGIPFIPKDSYEKDMTNTAELTTLKDKYEDLLRRYEDATETISLLKRDLVLCEATINELIAAKNSSEAV